MANLVHTYGLASNRMEPKISGGISAPGRGRADTIAKLRVLAYHIEGPENQVQVVYE